ncbi:MAG: cyclase family protein [Oscillospiraceae bacterium]|nr:cyclase family protein [Oscillospiraceae bacterium]
MEIYDISQEVFGCKVFPGDPAPEKRMMMSIENGDIVDLTAFSMCAHNGTHTDAPCHFIRGGKSIDRVPLDKFVGYAYVARHHGDISAQDAMDILEAARAIDPRCAERILVGGEATVTADAARVFADQGIKLFGNESQTVGPEDAPMEVHLIMLGAEIVLLEGIRLDGIAEGEYILHSAPLCLGGADGAPCRATLMRI